VTTVHVVVPDGIDDPARPSGGNVYDRQVARGLISIGWTVHEHVVPGNWPRPDATALAILARVLERVPDDAVVLLDGLVASAAPAVLVPLAGRLRLVVLVHMPLGHRPAPGASAETLTRERAVLSVAAAVVTTSSWSEARLRELYALPAGGIHVAPPAVEAAELATGTLTGESLLCVASVTFDKGHDLLLDALTATVDLSWRCVCVGSLDRDPEFAQRVRRRAHDAGVGDRLSFPGPRTRAELGRTYAGADLVVLASRAETYGMVIIEALARGLPVVTSDVGGVPEALGHIDDGTRPGLLVPPEDPPALATALRAWLTDAQLRHRLRQIARARRESLPRWSHTAAILADVLAGASG
jgi:glycosyltransferase involved in cell wall biosynthesis